MDKYRIILTDAIELLEIAEADPDGWEPIRMVDSFGDRHGNTEFVKGLKSLISKEIDLIEERKGK